jgi:hypothetical protein
LPEGKGYFYADAAYDSRRVPNTVVDRAIFPALTEEEQSERIRSKN